MTADAPIANALWSIEHARKIVAEWQHGKVGGVRCDAFTASAVVQFYDRLNPANQRRFTGFPFSMAVKIMWATLNKAKESKP